MRLRLEDELLLRCVQTTPAADLAEWTGNPPRAIDWAYLVASAKSHGLVSLLHRSLNKLTSPGAVPEAILTQLREHAQTNTWHGLSLTGQLFKVLALFEAHQIPVVSFKGPVLASALYGTVTLRPFSDLDLLVHRQDVLKASHLLLSQQYRPAYLLTPAQEAALLESQTERLFARDGGTRFVDLHWALAPSYLSFSRHTAEWWGRLEPVSLAGKQILTFSSEDLLLFLCLHGARHCWERLVWVCDVDRLIAVRPWMNWDQVCKQAAALGCARILGLGLFLASRLLGTPLPTEVWKRMEADPVVESLAIQVCDRLFTSTHHAPGSIRIFAFFLKSMDSMKDKGRFSVDVLMTPTVMEWMLVRLPPWLSFLYYPIRVIRLVGKYGSQAARRIWQAVARP